jgi:hypothetical protein
MTDPYEDDDDAAEDCCPWREPLDRHNAAVDRLACEVLGHKIRKSGVYGVGEGNRYCARFCGWSNGVHIHVNAFGGRGFRDLIDSGMGCSPHGYTHIVNIRDSQVAE